MFESYVLCKLQNILILAFTLPHFNYIMMQNYYIFRRYMHCIITLICISANSYINLNYSNSDSLDFVLYKFQQKNLLENRLN